MSVRIGVTFRPQLPPERLREFVARAELSGVDDVWLWEDCFLEGGLTTAAAALAWTGTVRVAVGLMPVPLRNPALAAMEVATLARLFPGRFLPCAGHGVLDWMGQVGARAASPTTLLREWVAAVRALLRGEEVSARGDYVTLDRVRLGWPPETVPPVLVGARGPRTLALAGDVADGVVLDDGITPRGVRESLATAAFPGTPQVAVYVLAAPTAGSRAAAEAELAASDRPGPRTLAAGSPAQVADLVGELAAAGATTVAFQAAGADPDAAALIDFAAAARAELATR
jgi:5,10-methylenetetrahydromethanopterin reductase